MLVNTADSEILVKVKHVKEAAKEPLLVDNVKRITLRQYYVGDTYTPIK